MRHRLRLIAAILSAALPVNFAHAADSPLTANQPAVEEGQIQGAQFTVLRPARWNRHVLLIAHGYVPEGRPLQVDLSLETPAYRTLVNEGWLVGKTSYRRNGIIVTDAIADVNALLELIVKKYGKPDRVILEGESMGGLIVTLLAERAPQDYQGAVAIGAALQIDEPGAKVRPSGQPKIPLIFMSNQTELDGPLAYSTQPSSTQNPALAPAVFRISRDGHVNVNQAERLVALRALNAWIDSGRGTLPVPTAGATTHDATVIPRPTASRVVVAPDRRGFKAHVTAIARAYGNVFVDAQTLDFETAGIAPQTWFDLVAHGQSFRAFYGSGFDSVKEGEWVVFPDADGFTCVCRNFADAAGSARLSLGDEVTVRPSK
ncbi:MAG: alpha/beta hydrolase [Opitutus sp.]